MNATLKNVFRFILSITHKGVKIYNNGKGSLKTVVHGRYNIVEILGEAVREPTVW